MGFQGVSSLGFRVGFGVSDWKVLGFQAQRDSIVDGPSHTKDAFSRQSGGIRTPERAPRLEAALKHAKSFAIEL